MDLDELSLNRIALLRTVDDLASLDPELYHGLMILKNFTGDVESELSLNFTVTDEGELLLSPRDFAPLTLVATLCSLLPCPVTVPSPFTLLPTTSTTSQTLGFREPSTSSLEEARLPSPTRTGSNTSTSCPISECILSAPILKIFVSNVSFVVSPLALGADSRLLPPSLFCSRLNVQLVRYRGIAA